MRNMNFFFIVEYFQNLYESLRTRFAEVVRGIGAHTESIWTNMKWWASSRQIGDLRNKEIEEDYKKSRIDAGKTILIEIEQLISQFP